MSDLDAILPRPVTIIVAGETVTIGKLRFGQVPEFAAAVARPWPMLVEGDWLGAAILHNADIRTAISLLCDRHEAWLSELAVDDFVHLAGAAFGLNMDFFVQAVLPAVRKATQTLVQVGSSSVTASSPPDTAFPIC